jgi:hypothetical protein
VRHYAAPDGRGGRFTKSPKHQLDLLAEALPADLGRVNNGYLQASKIRDLGTAAAAVEQNFNQIRVCVHDDAQVVLGYSRDGVVEGETRMSRSSPRLSLRAGMSKRSTGKAASAQIALSPSMRAATPILAIMIRRTQRLSISRDA